MSSPRQSQHIAVVGAGPGGLTAAMILAHRGFRVSVFEAQPHVGGRNACIREGGFTFDVGPTFLMLKAVLDEVFLESGTRTDQVLDARELDPMYRLQFAGKAMDVSSDHERMKAEIGRCFPGREAAYDQFIAREKLRFERLFPCLQKSYHRLRTLFSPPLLKALPHLALGRSLFSVMHDTFGDNDLALSFTFQSKYLGMSPWQCPGLFAMIPYIEHGFGIFHPIGGLSRISDAMAEVARAQGAELHLETPVKRILVKDRAAVGVQLASGDTIACDDVIINADFGIAMQTLFEPGVLRRYTPAKLRRMKLSCSTFMLYLGLDCTLDLPHHTIFFAEDYRGNVDRIFAGEDVGEDLSFYLRNASITDPTLAPEGKSALYVLVPVPNLRGAVDWTTAIDSYRERTLKAIERRAGLGDIRKHIEFERIIAPPEWQNDYHVFDGATFNLAHNLGQMIYRRPHNKFEEIDHCYLVGGGTHPGSGLPTIYESGRISANLISRHYGARFLTRNLEV